MTTVTALEAKTRFGDLLARVQRGEEIVITKHDRPVARIVPEGIRPKMSVVEAVDGILALRKKIKAETKGRKKLTYAEVKSAKEEGRP